MTVTKAFVTVLLWAVIFSLLGSLAGGILGVAAPDYYRLVFHDGKSPDFNPIHTGIGLGLVQGFAAGVVIALTVLAIFAFRDSRSKAVLASDDEPKKNRGKWTRFAVWFITTSLAVIVFSLIAFVIGGIIAQEQLYRSWNDQKIEKVEKILESESFAHIEIQGLSYRIYLNGTVATEEIRNDLRQQLILAFGTEMADLILRSVEVAESKKSENEERKLEETSE